MSKPCVEEIRECELLPGGLSSQHLLPLPLFHVDSFKCHDDVRGCPGVVQAEDCWRGRKGGACDTDSAQEGLQIKLLGDNLSPSLEHGILIFEKPPADL